MGADAIAAYLGVPESETQNPNVLTSVCAEGNSVGAAVEDSSGQVTGAILWFLTGSMAGQVITISGDIFGSGNFGPGECTEVALASWD